MCCIQMIDDEPSDVNDEQIEKQEYTNTVKLCSLGLNSLKKPSEVGGFERWCLPKKRLCGEQGEPGAEEKQISKAVVSAGARAHPDPTWSLQLAGHLTGSSLEVRLRGLHHLMNSHRLELTQGRGATS